MFRLTNVKDEDFSFTLLADSPHVSNRYTTIIGANGTGKSQLLTRLVEISNHLELELAPYRPPASILALTNLVSDSFPSGSRVPPNYRYLGLRQAFNSISTGSLIDSTVQFFAACVYSPGTRAMLRPVLELLGFSEYIVFFERLNQNRLPTGAARRMLSSPGGARALEIDPNRIDALLQELRQFADELPRGRKSGYGGGPQPWPRSDPQEDWLERLDQFGSLAAKYEVVLADLIRFAKRAGFANVSVDFRSPLGWVDSRKLSTGQMHLLSSAGRLVASIEPDSLIVIDEPETGLHPTWQSAFIPMLKATVPDEFGCHFFIATHSPHLVADATDVLIPTRTWGTFDIFEDPFFGRSVENVLYRVFGARVSGNLMVEQDLRTILAHLSEPDRSLVPPGTQDAVQRLTRIAAPDTVMLNDVLAQISDSKAV